jgi:hypothetical protein
MGFDSQGDLSALDRQQAGMNHGTSISWHALAAVNSGLNDFRLIDPDGHYLRLTNRQ